MLWGEGGRDLLDGGDGRNNGNAGRGNDTVRTAAGSGTINAGAGNDNVTSGAGGDRVYGLGGNDTIDSGTGHNIIIGGAGKDMLRGGPGAALFIFNDGLNGIRNFGPAKDRIDLRSFSGRDRWTDVRGHLRQKGGHVTFRHGNDVLRIEWTRMTALGWDNFVW